MGPNSPEAFSTALWEHARRDNNIFLVRLTSSGKNPLTIYGLLTLTPCFIADANHSGGNGKTPQALFDERSGRITIPLYPQTVTGNGGADTQAKLEKEVAAMNAKVFGEMESSLVREKIGRLFENVDPGEKFHRDLARQSGVNFTISMNHQEKEPLQPIRINFSTIGENGNYSANATGKARLFARNFNYIFSHLTLKPYV